MRQTILSVTLELKPESTAKASALVDALHDRAGNDRPDQADYGWFMKAAPSVHFLSMNVFPGAEFDPVFVLEANFDGEPSIFWGALAGAIDTDLRAILRCCKPPLDEDGPLYAAVTAPGSNETVATYFAARTDRTSVFHQGNRGMARDRIIEERRLFLAIRTELARPGGPYRAISPVEIHATLRKTLLPTFPVLASTPPPRIPLAERIADVAQLALFAILAFLVLSLPGLLLAPVTPVWRFFVLLLLAAVAVGLPLSRLQTPLAGTAVASRWTLLAVFLKALPILAIAGAIYFVVAEAITASGYWIVTGASITQSLELATRMVLLGFASAIAFSIPGFLLWVRWLERRDSSQDAPPIDDEVMRQMAQREDWIPQNHMGSIVILKPGVLRTIIVHAGHRALHLLLRVVAPDGYLGSMRTVHFAHWAFINNGSRLMFFSNFDQSWESYLDDFIEKAHVGLTLAWGCGVGFPPTRFLIQDGSSHGTKFKAWARHSMAVSRFWYSAYPDLTVDQIERNNRIAIALCKPALTQPEATAWINDL